MVYIKQSVSLFSCRKRTIKEIRDLIKESLQVSANLLSLVALDNAIENHIRRITFLKRFFAQIVYGFDLPADFVRGIHEVDNFLSNKINELERRFDMIGTCKQGIPRYEIHREELEGQRRSFRSSTERVDPIGKVLQRLRTLHRRKYPVEGPNDLLLVFFHHSFHYRVYFQIRVFSTKRFKKSLYS